MTIERKVMITSILIAAVIVGSLVFARVSWLNKEAEEKAAKERYEECIEQGGDPLKCEKISR